MKYIFTAIDECELLKNKAIKHILDSLDTLEITKEQKEDIRTTVLDEVNELYRKLMKNA